MLEDLLAEAISANDSEFSTTAHQRDMMNVILDAACSGSQKSCLAVILTLLLKKIQTPDQDIRFHQKQLPGGFSGRGLDEKTVTPFLRGQDFPYMKAGSGWLTRSLEQSAPYNLEYPGNIRPPKLKTSFLEFVQEIQHGNPRQFILYFLKKLAEWRTLNATLTLARPTNRRIEEIVKIVERHWDTALSGVAKLPVLAIYAAYDCLVPEIAKFRECRLREMRSHTASDTRSNWLGDIQVEDKDGTTIEAVEVKHNIEIKANLISGLKDKIAASGLKTFYILSTNEVISPDEMIKMTSVMIEIRNQYGCQVIINGVSTTLRYYLRLVNSTDRFIRKYVDLIESDSEIPYDLKFKWNQLNSSTDA